MATQFITMNVGGQKEVIGTLEEYEFAIGNKVKEAIEESTQTILMNAVEAAPTSSGDLLSRLNSEIQEKNGWIYGRVRSRARYSIYQEFGTGIVGSSSFRGERPSWHQYQQASMKELVYTKFGWAQREVRWRAGYGGRGGKQKRYVTGSLVLEQGGGKHDPPPIGKLKAWASLHGLNPYAIRTTIYRNQGIPAHPFLFPADKAEQPKFEKRIREAIGG